MTPTTPRDRSSLRDMAKLAASMPNPALPKPNADSSGHVDLEALLKIQPNWVDEAVARAKMGPVEIPEAPPSFSLAPPSLHPIAMDDIPLGVPTRNGMAIAAASGAALVLLGAALFFAWKTHATNVQLAAAPKPAPVAVAAARADALIPPPPPVAPVQTTPAAAPAPVADNAAPAAAADDAQDTTSAAPTTGGGHSKHVHHKGGHHAELESAMAPAAAPAPVAAAAAAPAHKGPAPKANSALDAALSQAAGPGPALPPPAPVAAPAPAAAAPSGGGDRPDSPSGSAVKDALMSVLSAAKACVSGESDASHVHVTWGSSGAMKSLDITGPAQSDPHAKLCLNRTFARAHVPAFSQPTYAANVTVRP
jgi:hypothetical protein